MPEMTDDPKELEFDGAGDFGLAELPNPDPTVDRPQHGGRDRHLAFKVTDLGVLIRRLEATGIPFSLSRSGRRALFCRDPDANALEFVELPSPA